MPRRPLLGAIAGAAIGVATVPLVAAAPAAASRSTSGQDASKPTIVLVHGAFADASGWAAVTKRLLGCGYPVHAPANPLRGLHSDAEYLRMFLSTITGPVVLVGHSYGGAVITNAAVGSHNVKALVYIAAYALDEGEAVAAANDLGGGHSDLINHVVLRPFPGAGEGDADGYIDRAHFRRLFAADLPATQAAVMATAQRPAALSTLLTPSGVPGWKTIPSWYVVAKDDQTIPPQAQRVMAARAQARTTEVRSSHVPMISRPDAVTHIIVTAATTA
ncbi:alpha/beta hydrolase [Micromonospora echinaurantiaca]|nr:alpha/beta hydrolase [Micromonospora echinaurantiaca]